MPQETHDISELNYNNSLGIQREVRNLVLSTSQGPGYSADCVVAAEAAAEAAGTQPP